MAQTTGRDSARSETGKAAEMAHDMVEQTTGAVAEGIAATAEAVQSATERMLDTAKELAAGAASPMVRLVLDRTAPAMQDMVKAESDLASFWLETDPRSGPAHHRDHAAPGRRPRRARGARAAERAICARAWRGWPRACSRQLSVTRTLTSSMFDAGAQPEGRRLSRRLRPARQRRPLRSRSHSPSALAGQRADPQAQRVEADEALGVALVVDRVLLEGGEGLAVEACAATCGRPPGRRP